MADVRIGIDGSISITDGAETLTYRAREVAAPDGSTIRHESRGGTLVSAWATSVGETFVEISHLGNGPEGGELVMVATFPDGTTAVALGGLVTDEIPEEVPHSWPEAVDLALGLVTGETLDSGDKDSIEDFHQRLLGVILG